MNMWLYSVLLRYAFYMRGDGEASVFEYILVCLKIS